MLMIMFCFHIQNTSAQCNYALWMAPQHGKRPIPAQPAQTSHPRPLPEINSQSLDLPF